MMLKNPAKFSSRLERSALNQKRAFNRAGEAGFVLHNPFACPIDSNFAQHALKRERLAPENDRFQAGSPA